MRHTKNAIWKKTKKNKECEINKYFDYDFINNMIKYYESDPFFVINSVKDYLKIYPNDFNAIELLAAELILIGRFDEAKKITDTIFEKINNETYSFRNDKKISKIIAQSKIDELKILFATEHNYYKILKYIQDNKEDLEYENKYDVSFLIFYLNNRLNPNLINKDKYNTYLSKQIVEYNEEDFKNHVKKHLVGVESEEEKSKVLFNEDFDFDKIYTEIKKFKNENLCIYRGFFDKAKYYKYDNCGLVNGKLTDYFRVIEFIDTGDFITMYPCIPGENLPNIDLNYIKEDKNTNVRRLSRVEKFNEKYNKFI